LHILVGSFTPAKTDAVRDAVTLIATVDPRFSGAEVREIDVTGAAPRMPMTEREIIDGARQRVQALIERIAPSGNNLYVGLESGLDPVADGQYAIKTWAAASDGTVTSVGGGGAITVPRDVSAEVIAGRELGDVIDALAGAPVRGTRGAWGLFTRDLVTRRDAFRTAVLSAFAPFYNGELFSTRRGSRGL
jgi:inosine/xanthosine triphosphatase